MSQRGLYYFGLRSRLAQAVSEIVESLMVKPFRCLALDWCQMQER